MKIVFDANPICQDRLTGIGILESEICRELIKQHPENSYVFNYFSLTDKNAKKQRMSRYISENTRLRTFPLLSSGIYKLLYGFIPLPYRGLFGKGDITHFFNFLIPPGVKGKKVCTIHDFAFIRYPETVTLRTRKMLQYQLGKTIKRADLIFVNSRFTEKELKELYGAQDKKVRVVYAGVDRALFRRRAYDGESRKILDKYGLEDKNYFLYLGTIEPRKNLERLVIGYARAAEKLERCGKDVPALALTGKLGWYYDKILERIKTEGVEKRIRLLGYVPDSEKPLLYSRSRAFVFPSLYEGFGMPVIEAMACGAPVLTSDAASLPEISGENAILCDPLSEYSIAKGLYRLATEPELCERLSRDGEEWSKRYTWEESAKNTYDAYKSLFEEQ